MRLVYATAVAHLVPITVPAVVIAEWWRAGVREKERALVMASASLRGDIVYSSDPDDPTCAPLRRRREPMFGGPCLVDREAVEHGPRGDDDLPWWCGTGARSPPYDAGDSAPKRVDQHVRDELGDHPWILTFTA